MKKLSLSPGLYNYVAQNSQCVISVLVDEPLKIGDEVSCCHSVSCRSVRVCNRFHRIVTNIIECELLTCDDLYMRLELSAIKPLDF